MTNPLDALIKKYEEQLVMIQKQKEEAKNAYDIACKMRTGIKVQLLE